MSKKNIQRNVITDKYMYNLAAYQKEQDWIRCETIRRLIDEGKTIINVPKM